MRAPLQVCSDMRLKRFVAPLMIGLLMGVGQEAMASDGEWFCRLVLCVQDPRGMTTEGDCRPPVEKMMSYMLRGKPIPTCHFSNGTVAHIAKSSEPFDPCPSGTHAAIGPVATARAAGAPADIKLSGNGQADQDGNLLPRACVGKVVGSIVDSTGSASQVTNIYDRIEWQQPQVPRAIDVYVDGQLNRRVRY